MTSGPVGAVNFRPFDTWTFSRAEARTRSFPAQVAAAPCGAGKPATVIAWIWSRTVECPNPACAKEIPLANSFSVSKHKAREAHVLPVTTGSKVTYQIEHTAQPTTAPSVTRSGARCIACGTAIPLPYVRQQGKHGHLGRHLMAVVAEGARQRVYLAPDAAQAEAAEVERPLAAVPDALLAKNPRAITAPNYGIDSHDKLYTHRQQHLLTTLVELIGEARQRCLRDGASEERADAISVYLTLWLGRVANRHVASGKMFRRALIDEA